MFDLTVGMDDFLNHAFLIVDVVGEGFDADGHEVWMVCEQLCEFVLQFAMLAIFVEDGLYGDLFGFHVFPCVWFWTQ